jgi:hypothetical protein
VLHSGRTRLSDADVMRKPSPSHAHVDRRRPFWTELTGRSRILKESALHADLWGSSRKTPICSFWAKAQSPRP